MLAMPSKLKFVIGIALSEPVFRSQQFINHSAPRRALLLQSMWIRRVLCALDLIPREASRGSKSVHCKILITNDLARE